MGEDHKIEIEFICEKDPTPNKIEAEDGELLTQVAHRAGVVIQQTCGGTPSCTDCRIVVKNGVDSAFYPPQGPELRLMGNVYFITHERLACQSLVKESGTVWVPAPQRREEKIVERAARFGNKQFFKHSSGGSSDGKSQEKNKKEKTGHNKEKEKRGGKKTQR